MTVPMYLFCRVIRKTLVSLWLRPWLADALLSLPIRFKRHRSSNWRRPVPLFGAMSQNWPTCLTDCWAIQWPGRLPRLVDVSLREHIFHGVELRGTYLTCTAASWRCRTLAQGNDSPLTTPPKYCLHRFFLRR